MVVRQKHLSLRLLLLLLGLALSRASLGLDVLIIHIHGLVNLELQSIAIIDATTLS